MSSTASASATPTGAAPVAPAAAAPAADAPRTIEGLVAKFTSAFQAKAALAEENTTLKARIAALEAQVTAAAAPADPSAPSNPSDQSAAQLAELRAQHATLTEQNTANAALAGLFATALGLKLADVSAVAPEALAKFGLKDEGEFAALSAPQKQQRLVHAAVESSLSTRTLAAIRELGFNAQQLPGAIPAGGKGGRTLEEVQAAMSEPGLSAVALGQLAAEANKLRDEAHKQKAASN